VIVHFVDIGGIVDHHCLNFLFIMTIWNVIIIPHIKDVEGGSRWNWGSQTKSDESHQCILCCLPTHVMSPVFT